jgi:hypothetical protein
VTFYLPALDWHLVFNVMIVAAAAALAFRFSFEIVGVLVGAR